MIGPITIALLTALFAWWFFTGAILFAVRLADRFGNEAHDTITIYGLGFFFLGIIGVYQSFNDLNVFNVYLGFFSALAIWGWIELAFLSGFVTGPNKSTAPPNIPEWQRFVRAWGTLAYHETLLLIVLGLMIFFMLETENNISMLVFAILYLARVSAKLNLYFGVPRINVEFIPEKLKHLPSHFRKRKLNWFFPISITALTFAVAFWLQGLFGANDSAEKTEYSLLLALTALALLEHWLMVLPLPDAKLWRWMLPAAHTIKKDLRSEEAHGL